VGPAIRDALALSEKQLSTIELASVRFAWNVDEPLHDVTRRTI